jgi:hypothetical protein
LSANQIGHQCRQATVFFLQPVVFDRHVLAFDVTGFVEALANAAARRAEAAADPSRMNPTTGSAGCCARETKGQATAAPPISSMNFRRRMCSP